MLIDRVVAGFKYGYGSERYERVRWIVQVEALLCTRVLAVRVAAKHLTALWPIAMAELQRVLLDPLAARPPLLLAACQLVDTLLAVLPDDFSSCGWMFVPKSSDGGGGGSWSHRISFDRSNAASAAESTTTPPLPIPPPLPTSPARAVDSSDSALNSAIMLPQSVGASSPAILPPSSLRHEPVSGFAALLEPLMRLSHARNDVPTASAFATPRRLAGASPGHHGARRRHHVANDAPQRRHEECRGLLRPSPDGRRRPLLGLRSLSHASELVPFSTHLHRHLAASAMLPRCAELDTPLLELLLGCEFIVPSEGEAMLAPYLVESSN